MVKENRIYQSNNYGPIKVIEKVSKADMFVIEFLRTGTVKKARGYQITSGCVRDPFAKNVCGVACTGDIKTKGMYKPYYSVWHDMINRCYNPKDKRYLAYKDVSVSDDWLIFKNFFNDIQKIEGYNREKFVSGDLVLDKDIKQRNSCKKIYSLETCKWVSKHENNKIQDAQQRSFVAISPSGEKYKDFNITEFARKHKLERKHISSALHGRIKTTRGWKFYYEEIV